MNFWSLSCLLVYVVSVFSTEFDCNYINLGFHLIQPVNECVIKSNQNSYGFVSMGHYCIDDEQIESRLYKNDDCTGNKYTIVNTFDCALNTTSFVKCKCNSQQTYCPTITEIQYNKLKDGSCDKTNIIESRTYLVGDAPDDIMDDNCFERRSDNKENGTPSRFITAAYWMEKLSVFKGSTIES